MNNYEKIKSMSIDEMAEFIDKYFACFLCDTLLNKKNTDCENFCIDKRPERIKQWLQKECEK